ncbi:MAG: hypothetical protein EU518_01335 [Promethearchaeota archaeon]|nr:MAG: hypothetical protein EU518_01335 [Candidatus Lokiarchaeota archaeon]
MDIEEFKEFMKNPSIETAMAFGEAITKKEAPIEDKRLKFREAFKIVGINDKLEAIINMWAVASMLESPIPPTQKIQAVREVLQDEELNPSMIEQWTNLIYDLNRAPKDVLDFIAIDIRNMRGISKELRKRLGHPNPERPYSK